MSINGLKVTGFSPVRQSGMMPLDAYSRSPHLCFISKYCYGTFNSGVYGQENLVMRSYETPDQKVSSLDQAIDQDKEQNLNKKRDHERNIIIPIDMV
jgi:hypothetical protein